MSKTETLYRTLVESLGYEWAEYSDCDEWTLSILFDDVEDDWED